MQRCLRITAFVNTGTSQGSEILTQLKIARAAFAAVGLAAGLAVLATNEASAKGCNGVVNPAVWGCAPWDNNNGPDFPNYKAPAKTQPRVQAPARVAPPTQGQRPAVQPNSGNQIISRDGAGLIGQDGAGMRK